jgi:transposase
MAKEVLRQAYKPEFKHEAVKLVKGGLSSAQVARDLGVHSNMVSRWVRESQADPSHSFPGKGIMKPEDAELDRLRKEIVKLKAERDLLKKATAYFAREST